MNQISKITHESVYNPRPLQREIHGSLKRFNCLVCHRGFGKTVLTINQLIQSAWKTPGGRFFYVAPLLKQARNIAWKALLEYSRPIARDVNINDCRVELLNDAEIKLYGADNPDAMRGAHLHGVVLDEYAQMNKKTWTEIILPALATHDGWVVFIGTPKGQNAFYEIYQSAMKDDAWYCALFKASQTGVFSPEQLKAMKTSMPDEEYEQELECSFQAANAGAYYGKQMAQLAEHITRVPYEPKVPVTTAWDLGIDDATAIWFAQQVGREVRLIDYYENSGEGLTHYAQVLKSKPYVYGDHLLPHDAEVKELGTGTSRVEVLQGLGINATVVPLQRVEDGINAVRLLLPRCYWDAQKCAPGITALQEYSREWVDKLETWRSSPRHDKWSHGADAFRYLAVGLKEPTSGAPLKYPQMAIA